MGKTLIHRAFWGIYSDNKNPIIQRRKKMDTDIEKLFSKGKPHKFICYTYGSENHRYLLDKGVDSILIDKNPCPYDLLTEQYLHKIKAIECAFEDGYDEILHLDWDCIPLTPIPEDMWDTFRKKENIQACLQQYRKKKCPWRGKKDVRKVGNGGGLYIGEKQVIKEIIKCWEQLRGPSIEPPISLYLDNRYGKWIGMEKYWELHEPELIELYRSSCYAKDLLKYKPNVVFKHYV